MHCHILVCLSVMGVVMPQYQAQDRYQNVEDTYQADRYQSDQYQADPYQSDQYHPEQYALNQYQDTNKAHSPYPAKKQHQQTYKEPKDEETYVPKPFAYQYGGTDSQGLQSSKIENQGEDGVVRGEYRVELPDGRTQVLTV